MSAGFSTHYPRAHGNPDEDDRVSVWLTGWMDGRGPFDRVSGRLFILAAPYLKLTHAGGCKYLDSSTLRGTTRCNNKVECVRILQLFQHVSSLLGSIVLTLILHTL